MKIFFYMSRWVFFHQANFLLTGIFQTLGAQWLYYQGAAHKTTFLTVAALYLGMSFVYILIPRGVNQQEPEVPHRWIMLVGLLDFLGNVCVTAGLFLVGSGVN
jgi:hypothetical protein